jgi:Ca-activated chloride channel family protein
MISELWNRLDPGFLDPVWLGVGLVAVLAVLLLELGSSRQRRQAVRLFAASHLIPTLTASVSPTKRMLKRVLLLTAVALLFVALARPHLFDDWREENRKGLDVLVAVDCSKSMQTEDVKPNRIERAKLALADFADELPDNRLGLIAFAGDAFLQCPLTLDHEVFQSAVRELDTDTIPRPGTDIATAIDQAIDALKSQPNNFKILILITDGEDLEGHVLDEARLAAQDGLKIYTVGVGTPEGGQIPLRDDSGSLMYLRDSSGEIVQSKLDEATLRQIASITGGAYVPLGRGEGLEEIYNRYISQMPKQNLEERREKIPVERFEWPLALAILLTIWEFLTGERAASSMEADMPASEPLPPRTRGRRRNLAATPLIALGLLGALGAEAARASATATAERDYQSGQYQDALDQYRQAAEKEPDRSDLQFNLGDAAYKAGNYLEAEQAFRKALETPDLNLQEKTYYNLGNSQFKDGAAVQKVDTDKTIDLWQRALQSYESALKLRDAADTRHNYQIVKDLLEKLKKQQQQQQQQQQKNDQQQKQQGQQNQNQSGNSSSQQQGKNDQQQNQQGQNQQSSQSPGNSPPPQADAGNKDQSGQQQQQPQTQAGTTQQRAYSQGRPEDKEDPGVKSREEAEALLDSLKEDEHHVTARALNALEDNQPPPPPPSGKDW